MRLAFELLDYGEISLFRQDEYFLVFVGLQELKYLFEENNVIEVEFRVILCDDILENTCELGKNGIVFLIEQLMGCIVDLQDNLRPHLQILRDKFLEEVDCIISVLFVEEVPAFVLKFDIDVPQHT